MKTYNSNNKNSAGAMSRLGRVLSLLTALMLVSVGDYANTFYIQGNNYNYWDTGATKNQMTNVGTNLYSVTININGANPYWFKVLEDSGSNTYWSNNGAPSCSMNDWEFYTGTQEPCKFSCSTSGDFTFTWNAQTHKLSISQGTPTPTTATWYLAGSFTDWGTNKIQFTGDGNTLTCSRHFDANQTIGGCNSQSGFKIVKNDGSDHWIGNNCQTITSVNTSASFSTSLSGNDRTCGITTTVAGNYTFTLDISNPDAPALTVTYPGSDNKPKVHIGSEPVVTQGSQAIVYAYIKATGCSTVDKIRAYYSASQFTEEPETFVELVGDFKRGSDNAITLSEAELSNVIAGTGLAHVKVAAHNTDGWSALSDEICFMWTGCQTPTVTVVPPAQTELTPFDQFVLEADGACYIGDVEWSYTCTSPIGAAPIIEKSNGGKTINVRIPRPAGTVDTPFSKMTYTFTATVRNGDNTSTDSCDITLKDATEDCKK